MMKAKKYDWKDSNMALFGSDTEKTVKKESAKTEQAWSSVGDALGVRIWRIVKFKVEDWPKEDYGKFFNGDSYIILNTYKDAEEIKYDVHFWIGRYSTQDEYGTAAYKTVELDTFLDDAAVQHRETEGHESKLFHSYFESGDGIEIMKGGADSGFRQAVKPPEHKLLWHIACRSAENLKAVSVTEVPCSKSKLNYDDVFILDLGLQVYQWNGRTCNRHEKFRASVICKKINEDRENKCKIHILEQDELAPNHPFYKALSNGKHYDDKDELDEDGSTELYRVSDETGSMELSKVKEGSISISDFQSKDVFLLDTPSACIVWIGSGASTAEKKNGMAYAHSHLKKSKKPFKNITVLKEGQPSSKFTSALTA